MIAPMMKYDFVLFAAQREDFIEKLRELGLVEITTTGWEPSDEERQLMLDLEGHAKALDFVRDYAKRVEKEEDKALKQRLTALLQQAKPFASKEEAYRRYLALQQQAAQLRAEIGRLEKVAEELRPWGAFDVQRAAALAERGIVLHYFSTQAGSYDKSLEAWSTQYTVAEVARTSSMVWFVVIAAPGEEIAIDAQEMKMPTMDVREAERQIAAQQAQLEALDAEFARVVASQELLEAGAASLKEQLQGARVQATAREAADGTLLVMEGWAERETSEKVDALLEAYPNVVYLKQLPTPEDDTPVKLKNNRFARIFEMVGDMYARPKYGTLDLTPFFAPFYMLFFGICLNDAGYGAILLVAGLYMLWKYREGSMRRAAWFATLCAASTVLFGLLCGSVFGLNLKEYYPDIPFYDFQGKFFAMALVIGVVQILFGMVLNIWTKIRCFGFSYALGTLGWFIILLACCLAAGLPMAGLGIPGFTTDSVAFYVALGIGGALLLLLNNPKRNPIVNIGAGLWELYNNITGLMSDVLSYIRLFAIGLSGGVLASVFNTLAVGFVPDDAGIVTRIVIMVPILLIGHVINLFMSTISSFVHPMRLTFVEFFKNAGFEMSTRLFDPLRKMKANE